MPNFTIETSYHLPVYRHRTYEAATVEDACRLAIEDDDWSGERQDYDTAGETYVSGIWPGSGAAYEGVAIPVPPRFAECIQRKANHFDALVAVLKEAAQPMGLSRTDFERWLPIAQSIAAKADAIQEGRRDPEPAGR